MEWSEWHPLTLEGLSKYEPRMSGIYRIALRDAVVEYPKGVSPVIFIGAAPIRRLTERLQDHLKGWSNQCIYLHFIHGDALQWQNLIAEDAGGNADTAAKEFFAEYGALPACNQSTLRKLPDEL